MLHNGYKLLVVFCGSVLEGLFIKPFAPDSSFFNNFFFCYNKSTEETFSLMNFIMSMIKIFPSFKKSG